MNYLCLYYSATGNTERAVALARKEIVAEGSSFESIPLEKGTRLPALSAYDGVIVAFPVLAFSPPVFVSAALKKMPRGEKETGGRMKGHVLAVDGGGGGAAVTKAARLLEKRGYEVLSRGKASYPSNWIQVAAESQEAKRTEETRSGDAAARAFARSVLASEAGSHSEDGKRSVGEDALSFMFALFGRRILGKLFYADEDCDSCGLCARNCPSRTILLGRGRGAKPYWRFDCANCNACMNLCPKAAINMSIGRIVVYSAVVLLSAVLGVWAYSAPFKAAVGWAFPPLLAVPIDIVAIAAIITAAHFFPVGLIDRFFLRFLQRLPGFRNFFAWTFTKGRLRYKAARIGS